MLRTNKVMMREHMMKLLLLDSQAYLKRIYRLIAWAQEEDLTGNGTLKWEKVAKKNSSRAS